MASELNMYQSQVNEYKFDIERISREMQDLKRRYFSQKKKDQISMREKYNQAQGEVIQPLPLTPEHPKFVGAGFNMNTNISVQ